MKLTGFSFEKVAFYLTCGSVVSILFSIAVSNILLALAFAALLMSGQRMRFPPFWIPLLVFFAGTVVALVLSPDPSGGRPAIRKFFCFLTVVVVYSTIRNLDRIRALVLVATGITAFSALWSLIQFAQKVAQAEDSGRPFYTFYMQERITGFMSHWMTLGGQEMIVSLMACSLLFFWLDRRWKLWIIAALAIIAVSIAAGFAEEPLVWDILRCRVPYLVLETLGAGADSYSDRAAVAGKPVQCPRARGKRLSPAWRCGLERVSGDRPPRRYRNGEGSPVVRAWTGTGEGSSERLDSGRCAAAASGRLVRACAQPLCAVRSRTRHSHDAGFSSGCWARSCTIS